MAEPQPSKLVMRVRFPSPAPSPLIAASHWWRGDLESPSRREADAGDDHVVRARGSQPPAGLTGSSHEPFRIAPARDHRSTFPVVSHYFDEHAGDPYGGEVRQNKENLAVAGEGADADYDQFFSGRRSSFDDAAAPMTQAPAAPLPSYSSPVASVSPSERGAPKNRSRLFDKPRSDKVMGQYWKTFGERRKATGGGIRGFFSALMGKGMARANVAKYGIYA